MNAVAAAPGPAPLRAALLMFGSAMAFGLMAIAIRLATAYVPTQEVAFFRNAFGLLALLPVLLRPGHAPLRTQQLPRYLLTCPQAPYQ